MSGQTAIVIDSDPAALGQDLVRALADASMPPMLRNLLKTAQVELQEWYEGGAARGLAIARYALAEWKRWRVEPAPGVDQEGP